MAARDARLSLLRMYWLQASSLSVSTYESSSVTAGSAAATAREPRLEPASSCSCSFLSSVDPNPSEWTDSSRCSYIIELSNFDIDMYSWQTFGKLLL